MAGAGRGEDEIMVSNLFKFSACKSVIIKIQRVEIRQPVYLHRIQGTRIGYAINQWSIDLSHSLFDKFALQQQGKMHTFCKYLSRRLPPLGEVARVDSVKIANEVRVPAGMRH